MAIIDEAFFRGQTHVVDLAGGTSVLVRPIRPDDKEGLQDGLRRLSPESRYLRFFSEVDALSARELRYLTELDYRDHFAWVAMEHPSPSERPGGIGVARYIRLKDEPQVAEAAVAVVDDWQRRGIGRLLTTLLAKRALENGIRWFRAYVLPDNQWLVERFRRAHNQVQESDGLFVIDIDLAAASSSQGAVAALEQIASGPPDADTVKRLV